VTATIAVGHSPEGVAVSLDGSTIYVYPADNTVSAIDAATNMVTATVPVGTDAEGVAVKPNSSTVLCCQLR
jgi:YVTN family beta-propeller protein